MAQDVGTRPARTLRYTPPGSDPLSKLNRAHVVLIGPSTFFAATMGKTPPSVLIDRLLATTGDWRGPRIARFRRTMLASDPEMVEDWKWMGTPTWSHEGIVAIANPHKGASRWRSRTGRISRMLRNCSMPDWGGSLWRTIYIFESDTVNERAFKALVRPAVTDPGQNGLMSSERNSAHLGAPGTVSG
jgi:hypothetical protein